MTVGELINELECFNEETKVVILPTKTHYIESVDTVRDENCSLFDYDEDQNVVIIEAGRQCGHE